MLGREEDPFQSSPALACFQSYERRPRQMDSFSCCFSEHTTLCNGMCIYVYLCLLRQNENLMIKIESILPGFKLHTCGWQLIQVYYYPDKLLANKAAPRAYFQVQQYIRYNSPNHLPSPFPPIWLHFNSKFCLERCQELSNDELTAQLPWLPAS